MKQRQLSPWSTYKLIFWTQHYCEQTLHSQTLHSQTLQAVLLAYHSV